MAAMSSNRIGSAGASPHLNADTPANPMALTDLFPDKDFHFHLRFKRGNPADFFAPGSNRDLILAQRRHWLATAPDIYAALLPAAERLLAETLDLARAWSAFQPPPDVNPASALIALGQFWEPDYLLLKFDQDHEIRLYGGCLCFPSSWRLTDKLRQPIESIHSPVPHLNQSIGRAIHRFLDGLKPDAAYLRHNWGLARTPELNHHPDRDLPRLDTDAGIDEVWLRVEHQALVALPKSDGLLFAIRISLHPLAAIKAEPLAAARLARALATMPSEMARYKGLEAARPGIIRMLEFG
jgi:hypothetical protein